MNELQSHVTIRQQVGIWWRKGVWQKVGIIALPSSLFLLVCCSLLVVLSLTPAGQELIREANATATAEAQLALLHGHETQTVIAGLTATPTHTQTVMMTPTITTTRPNATATKIPLQGTPLSGATFGGTEAGFFTKYGNSPDDLWQLPNGITFSINLDTGLDGHPHVFGMLIYRSDASTWALPQAEQICSGWNPPDAHLMSTTGSGNTTTQVFQSANLAATFSGGGTFHIDYEPPHGGNMNDIFQCGVSLG